VKCTIEEQIPRKVTSTRGKPVYTHSANDSCRRNVDPCPMFDTQHSDFDGCSTLSIQLSIDIACTLLGRTRHNIRQPQQRHSSALAPLMHSISILKMCEDAYLGIHSVQRSRRKETMDDCPRLEAPSCLGRYMFRQWDCPTAAVYE
jgi:hypothetical protein